MVTRIAAGPALSRREVLQLLAGAGIVALQPRLLNGLGASPTAAVPVASGFLTADELAILDASTALILPTDDKPGAREIGVVDYIQGLLSFFPGTDANCDRSITATDITAVAARAAGQGGACAGGGDVNGDGIVDDSDVAAARTAVFGAPPPFGGGPFSGRNPQPHFPIGHTPCQVCHGVHNNARTAGSGAATVNVYPTNAFRQFLPLNRLQTLSWKLRLLGPQAVPEAESNPLLAELPEVDLRARYRNGLTALDTSSQEKFGKHFVELTPVEQQQVLDQASPTFVALLYRHVVQGTLCAPEYGGNRNQLGWQLVGFDGDSQPLGYEIYDESAPGFYRERPDKPNSGPNTNEGSSDFSPKMKQFLRSISRATEGRPFRNPYRFEVDR